MAKDTNRGTIVARVGEQAAKHYEHVRDCRDALLTPQERMYRRHKALQSDSEAKMAAAVTPESLPRHFEEFDQIFRDTGLPPIWDGSKLVPWRVFHQQSILVAKQCHEQLGIIRPQKELRGPYAKPVWDPSSEIWQKN